MKHKNHSLSSRRTLGRDILFISIASLLAVQAGFAADAIFSSGAFTGDADSGVGTAKTYTAIANIIGSDVTVNGKTFIGSGTATSGTGWALTNVPNLFGGGGNHTTTFGASSIDNLFDGFQFGGNPGTLTLSELTPGQTYVATLYNEGWAWPGFDDRTNILTSSEGATIRYNPDGLEASMLKYTFVATGATTTINTAQTRTNYSLHMYGLSNEQVFNNTWTPAVDSTWETGGNWSVATPNAVGANASFSAQAGATSVSMTGNKTVGHVQFLGTGSYTVSGIDMLTLQADAGGTSVLKADAGGSHTISMPVTINSPLAKYGEGSVRIAGPVTGSGKGVTISSGTLAIESSSPDLNSLGDVANSGTFAVINAGAQTMDKVISGSGGVSKSGAGVLTLGGVNTYTGPTVVSDGTLKLGASATTIALTIANASFQTYTSLGTGNATFGYNSTGASWTFSNATAGIALNGSPWFTPTNHDGTAGGFIQSNSTAGTSGFIEQAVNVAYDGFYDFSFQGVGRGGVNGPSGLFFQMDGVTVKTFAPAEFSQATWQNYAASTYLTAGIHTVKFLGNNTLGGDRSTVIDAVTGSTTGGGKLPSNTALSLTNSGATLDLNGYGQTVGSLAGATGSSVINAISFTAGGDGTSTTFGGVISGAGSFTKAGNGTMTLTAANTYGGSTTISGGTLTLAGGSIPATALNLTGTGATLNTGGSPLTVPSLNLAGSGATLNMGGGVLTVPSLNITGSGATLNTGGSSLTLTSLNLTGTGATLSSGGGALTVPSLSGVSGTVVNLGSGALTVGDATSTTFRGTVAAGTVTKQGNGKLELLGAVSNSGALNVQAGTLKMGTANSATTGTATLTAGSTWDLGASSHTVGGLTGSGAITRSGLISTGLDGAAQISTSKTYVQKLDFGNNGGATVNGVTFDSVGNNGTGYSLTAPTLFGGTDTGGYDQLVGDFYYAGNPGVLTFSNLNPGETYEAMLYTKVGHWANRAQNATFDEDGAGPISNQLLNTDPGNLGYYAYRFVAPQASMSISMAAIVPASTFHWFAASLESVATAPQTLTVGDSNNYSFGGAINGPTKLVKQGTGIQELTAASGYTGGTNISGGMILSRNAAALGTGAVSIASGASLLPWWNTGSAIISNNFTLNGPGGSSPGGAKTAIYADGGAGASGAAGFAEYTLTGNITLAATSNLGGNNSNNLRVSGPINGPGGLTKGGDRPDEANTLILANTANNYAGNTLITKGTVKLAASEVIPHGAGKGGLTVNTNTTLDLGGFSETINSLSGGGAVTSTASIGTPVVFNSDAGTGISNTKTYTHALDFADGPNIAINGVNFISAGLTGEVTPGGPGWSLTGASPAAGNGATTATGDISRLLTNFYYGGDPANLTLTGLTPGVTYESHLYQRRWGGDRTQLFTISAGSGTGTMLFDSDLSGSASYIPLRYTANVSGTATITTNMVGAGTYHWYGMSNEVVASPVLTVGDATNSTYSGSISGPLGLTKTGAGTLELSGANTNTGPTTVTGGKLLVSGSLSGTTAIAVNAGTLGGGGTINPAANVTVASGADISPGNSIGTLSTGPVAFANGSAFTIELGSTTSDKLLVTGSGSLAGTVTLNLSLVDNPTDYTTFTLLDGSSLLGGYASGARFSFGGNSLDEGEEFELFSGPFYQAFTISYASDGGNDVTLLAVPEPGSAVLLLGGLATLAGFRRRRSE